MIRGVEYVVEAVHETGSHGGTIIGRGRVGAVVWTLEVATDGMEERLRFSERGPSGGGGGSSGGLRSSGSEPLVQLSGSGSSPERWHIIGSLGPVVERLVLRLSNGTVLDVPAMGRAVAGPQARTWFAVLFDLAIDIASATAVHGDGTNTDIDLRSLFGDTAASDLSGQRALAAAVAAPPHPAALELWTKLTDGRPLPEPRGEVAWTVDRDEVPRRWPLRPLYLLPEDDDPPGTSMLRISATHERWPANRMIDFEFIEVRAEGDPPFGGAWEAAHAGALVLVQRVGWAVEPGCYDPPAEVVELPGRKLVVVPWHGVRAVRWWDSCPGVPSDRSWLTFACDPPWRDPTTARGPLSVMLAGPASRWTVERLVDLARRIEAVER
jgi:hypothetical protein